MQVNPRPGSFDFGLCVRCPGDYQLGRELRIEARREKVGWRDPRSSSWAQRIIGAARRGQSHAVGLNKQPPMSNTSIRDWNHDC